jgi:hypothetical protein
MIHEFKKTWQIFFRQRASVRLNRRVDILGRRVDRCYRYSFGFLVVVAPKTTAKIELLMANQSKSLAILRPGAAGDSEMLSINQPFESNLTT